MTTTDPPGFLVAYPVSVLFEPADSSRPFLLRADGRICLVAFTDGHLAELFTERSHGLPAVVAAKVHTRERLTALLRLLKPRADGVMFDPPAANVRPPWVWPIDHVVRRLECGHPL
jgi:hypothetical protein